ncbi:MAG TPA: DUF2771 domain-containing protein [Candidatus Corynebacterium avicola]|uniref:DUF2771 domain-containing protein n=1 Tax=Candidatus Corynebacterium avicola TaxID=2838527 RepID=A0A9D1UK16_9CORY|nr:DUF2771 domain-containing protein [Candidatus Corynebacterium avicola]
MSTVPSGQTGAKKPTGSTKKQRRKATQRRQLLTFVAIVVLVLVVAGAVWGVQRWMDSRPGTAPEDLRLTVEINGEEQEYAPYQVCQRFTGECDEKDPVTIDVDPEDEITLKVPDEISSQDWSALQIFDNQAADAENTWAAGETSEVKVPASAAISGEGNANLAVVEVHGLIIGEEDGEEVPYGVVWAFSTGVEPDEDAAADTEATEGAEGAEGAEDTEGTEE